MSVTKLRGTLQDYFESMIDRTIEEVAIFNDELVIFLDDGKEVCIFEGELGLSMQINEKPDFDD